MEDPALMINDLLRCRPPPPLLLPLFLLLVEEEEEDVQAVVEAKVKEMPEEAAVELDPKPATSDVETVETVETNDFVTTNSTSLGTFLNNDK